MTSGTEGDYRSFFEEAAPRLQSALVAGFGLEDGKDAASEALGWAWRNWERLSTVDNRIGYLYRVGRNHALRQRDRHPKGGRLTEHADGWEMPDFEPGLVRFMADLPEQQRVCVWMVHGLGHTLAETADLLGCSRGTVSTHVQRALRSLRDGLEVQP
ncbi:MAG: sigma factor-like helix-turn-helix DNA-binding protein [Actinomycetota bacterium]